MSASVWRQAAVLSASRDAAAAKNQAFLARQCREQQERAKAIQAIYLRKKYPKRYSAQAAPVPATPAITTAVPKEQSAAAVPTRAQLAAATIQRSRTKATA